MLKNRIVHTWICLPILMLAGASVYGAEDGSQSPAMPELTAPTYRFSPAEGLGLEKGVCRRDPSDVIRVGDTYYLWYTKVCNVPGVTLYPSGYWGTVWYATSQDGHAWTERGEALGKGGAGAWDENAVFTPNILVAEGKYYLFYTGVPTPFENRGNNVTKTAIGAAISDSPDGPWSRLEGNPLLAATDDPGLFDSMRVDDACLIVREGKYWLYFKGRQIDRTPTQTKMGVAIAGRPEGPYERHPGNPIVDSGHEVLVWPHRLGVATLLSRTGPQGGTLQHAADGLNFEPVGAYKGSIPAPGAYRPEAFTNAAYARGIDWGIAMQHGPDPYLVRFDIDCLAPALPEVLIIGDSISIGYTPAVQRLLAGRANVRHSPGNAGHSGMGRRNLDAWLGDTKWDAIQFNWGIWDLCYRHPDAEPYGHRDKMRGDLTNTLEQYESNLRNLVERLKATGARLIWATTTPVPPGEAGRFVGDAVRYNAVAERIMKENGIAITDLYGAILPHAATFQKLPGDVHFSDEANEVLARRVADGILAALKGDERSEAKFQPISALQKSE